MTFRSWTLSLTTAALVFLPAVSKHTQHAQTTPGPYELIVLGSLGGGNTRAFDINDAGQITGYSSTATLGSRAFLLTDGQMVNLGVANADDWQSAGLGINGLGHVAGQSTLKNGFPRAVLFRNGTVVKLTPELPAYGGSSSANAVNDSDQVVGQITEDESNVTNGFLWQNGSRILIGDLGGGGSWASDINNAGQAVGAAAHPDITPVGQMAHAFLWQNGVTTDLGVLPGDCDSGASAINNLGVIVGSSGCTDPETYETFYKPFIYQNGTMTAISAPSLTAYAGDINDSGVVVGTMRAGGAVSPWHAWIYANGVLTNLNELKPAGTGLHLRYANAINNAGEIVGEAMDAQGRSHAYLLRPCNPCDPPPPPPPPPTPTLSINDFEGNEGRNGTTNFTFTVRLSAPATAAVAVNFVTANGTAIAGSDFNFANGTLSFAPGETSKTVIVGVRGDRTKEPDETFSVELSNASGATIFDGQGSGTIRNDDGK